LISIFHCIFAHLLIGGWYSILLLCKHQEINLRCPSLLESDVQVTVGLTDQFFMGDEVPNSDPVIAEEVKEEVEPVGVSYMVVGDLIIVAAQILVACQVVFEEKFVRRYEVIQSF